MEAGRITQLQQQLLHWFESTSRDLPWRRTRDPWSILVSELMLQQTQVARVIPKYVAFLDRFPTPTACAEGAAGEVLSLWSGLGYNRRALNLHRAAKAVVAQHGGVMPQELPELLALPGIGPYTARAVMAFAYDADEAVVDTNAARVLARAVAGVRLDRKSVQRLAVETVPVGKGWRWNSAILDLGATICRKTGPRCGECPLANTCSWTQAGWPSPDPAVGSAGTSTPQTPFQGSDRQGRGRLVAALLDSDLTEVELPAVVGWHEDPDRIERVVASLVADGLAIRSGDVLTLPGRGIS